MLDKSIISREFYNFEGAYSEDIKGKKLDGFNAWQIIKAPLFFGSIRSEASAAATIGRKPAATIRKLFLRLYDMAADLSYCMAFWFRFLVKKKECFVLLSAFSVDKPVKLKDGRFFNFLVDPFVSEKILDHFIYAELSLDGDVKEPSSVPVDFKIRRFDTVIGLYQRIFSRKKDTILLAEEISGLLSEHLRQQHAEMEINAADIANTMQRFHAEYKCWRILLRSLRPALIISSEKPGTGFMAAALSLGIPFLDLQHGLIDQYHPQYMYHPAMRLVKDELIIPSYVGVFGGMHRDILLKNGFWDSEEIAILGSSKVEMNRNAFAPTGTSSNLILLPTQWTCFEETITLLKAFIRRDTPRFKVILKLHPLEPEAYAEAYRSLASDNNDLVALADKDINIYDLILQSRLTLGFDSTVLLEAISLGRPCITLTTPLAPKGILSLIDSEVLGEAIEAVPYDDLERLTALLEKMVCDENYYQDRVQKTAELGDYLYSKDYYNNCRNLISGILYN